jgi:hypothetical protein
MNVATDHVERCRLWASITIGLDIAKTVLAVHEVDSASALAVRKRTRKHATSRPFHEA